MKKKIVFIGEGVLIKESIKSLKKKNVCDSISYETLDKADTLKAAFNGKGYDIAVFSAIDFSQKNDSFNSLTLVRFKNLQYAAILYGIKKLLILTDASDIIGEDGSGDEHLELPLLNSTSLISPIITSLSLKDKISTVLRFFYLFGKGIKRGEAAKILGAAGQKRTLTLSEDYAFSALFVDDAVTIISEFAEKDLPKDDYSVTTGEFITGSEFVKKVRAAAKKRGKIFNAETKTAVKSDRIYADDNEKLKAVLPNLKFTPLSTAIAKSLE